MLRGAVICQDRELGDRLVSVILESHQVGIVRRMESYPNAVELGRFMRAAAPEIIFLSIESKQASLEIARQIEELVPGTQIVAVNRTCDPPTLLRTMQARIREFLSPPFQLQTLHPALRPIGDETPQ